MDSHETCTESSGTCTEAGAVVEVGLEEVRQAARTVSRWQACLFGEHANAVRAVVAEQLFVRKGARVAFRYAMCGRGDYVVRVGDTFQVRVRGCQHRLCSRCSRRKGLRYVKRVLGWLRRSEKVVLHHVVLTQDLVGLSLREAYDANQERLRRVMKVAHGLGKLRSGLATIHTVWSERTESWHVHTHLLVDGGGCEGAEGLGEWLKDAWIRSEGREDRLAHRRAQFSRLVAKWDGLEEFPDECQQEFFEDRLTALQRAVVYPLRDVTEGVRLAALAAAGEERIREFVEEADCRKTFRLYGEWRSDPAGGASEVEGGQGEEVEGERVAVAAGVQEVRIGKVDRVFRMAREGVVWGVEFVRWLRLRCLNRTAYCRRVLGMCDAVLGESSVLKEDSG